MSHFVSPWVAYNPHKPIILRGLMVAPREEAVIEFSADRKLFRLLVRNETDEAKIEPPAPEPVEDQSANVEEFPLDPSV